MLSVASNDILVNLTIAYYLIEVRAMIAAVQQLGVERTEKICVGASFGYVS